MGGYANIYKGELRGGAVALKQLRKFTDEQDGGHGRRQVRSLIIKCEYLLTITYVANLPRSHDLALPDGPSLHPPLLRG